MKLKKFGVLGAAGLLAVTAVVPAFAQDNVLKIGISLPLSGGARADGGPTERGAQLAIDQANEAGGVGGYTLESVVLDHAVAGQYNAAQGAADMQLLVADTAVVGVVGPYNSDVAAAQIPIGNDAGLLSCSPANTRTVLTRLPEALDLRRNFPDRINYIRVAASDAFQGPAMADYAFLNLDIAELVVIDDVTGFGTGVADSFQARYEELGGRVSARIGAPPDTVDFTGIVSALPASAGAVFYGGIVTSGGGLLLKQMRQAGSTALFLGPDGIKNGSGADEGSLIKIAGAEAASGTIATVAAVGDFDARLDFEAAYAEHFKDAPDFKTAGAYSGPAHACATVIIESLRAVLTDNPEADQAAIREGVRAYATDSTHTFQTVLGTESFDAQGDTNLKYISFFVVDPTLLDGQGDWVYKEQKQFG